MARKITLYEVRRRNPEGSSSLGSRRLRTRGNAKKLSRYIEKRLGFETEIHPWKITPTAAELATLRRMGA